MVGKPNFSSQSNGGLLDTERALSMADEGGASGAEIEFEELSLVSPPLTSESRTLPWGWILGGVAVLVAAGALYLTLRNRAEPALQPE